MIHIPAEVVEQIVDCLDDDRSSLISCCTIGHSWRARSLVYLFRILQVTQNPYSFDRWWSGLSASTAAPEAFIRVNILEFAKLLRDLPHLLRFVVHLQIGDWLNDGEHDEAYAALLLHLRLPEGHSVVRLSLIGGFRFPYDAEALSRNFGNLAMLRTHAGQYRSLEEFAECLSAMPALVFLEVYGQDFSSMPADSTVTPVAPGLILRPPRFVAPCAAKLKMDTHSGAIPAILRWFDMDASQIASVEIVGCIIAWEHGWHRSRRDRPLGDLLRDPVSPMLRVIRALDLSFSAPCMLQTFATLVNHLPAISRMRCTIQHLWVGSISQLFDMKLSATSLLEIELIYEGNFTSPWMLTNACPAILVALNHPKWSKLRSLVLRMKWNDAMYESKALVQQSVDNLFFGTKVSMFLEGKFHPEL